MARRTESLEDSMGSVTEDMIYVAVGKDVKEGKAILLWALQNSGGKRICVLHVHQPALYIPLMGAKVPANSLKDEIVRQHQETERAKMLELLNEYILFCRQSGVRAERLVTERNLIEDGILELISQHGIKKLVMGATSGKNYKKKMKDISSNKAKNVREKAPSSCCIQFICKGLLIFTRDAEADTRTEPSNHMRSRSVTLTPNRYNTESLQPNPLISQSTIERPNGDCIGRSIFDNSLPAGAGEIPYHRSRLDVEVSSHESNGLSRSLPRCSTSSSKRAADTTISLWKEQNENGLQLNVPSSSPSYSRSHSQEVPSSLLPRSPPSVPSASMILRCSSGALNVVEVSCDKTLYEQLDQSMAEVEKETHRRLKAERDFVDAVRRGRDEMVQRKELEQALVREREELEKVKNQRDQVMEELRYSQDQGISLKIQIVELQNEMNKLQVELNKLVEALNNQLPQFFEFSISELEEATQKFDESQKIGQGGYGNVYKGLLRQTEVAIKVLGSHNAHGITQFQMEVDVLSQSRHAHLVKLLGSCPEVFALIYEYLPSGSLEDRLTCKDNSPPLSWLTRIRIAIELCSVITYLHSIKPHSIVHGDLKPSNILLDANLVTKLSDFGTCRLLSPVTGSSDNGTLYLETVPKGSLPYIDPEFLETGTLTLKSDVYAFGIILLQLLTGRPPFSLSNDVKCALDDGNLNFILDPLAGDWPVLLAQKVARLALNCCDRNRRNRPNWSDVWKVLNQ